MTAGINNYFCLKELVNIINRLHWFEIMPLSGIICVSCVDIHEHRIVINIEFEEDLQERKFLVIY